MQRIGNWNKNDNDKPIENETNEEKLDEIDLDYLELGGEG